VLIDNHRVINCDPILNIISGGRPSVQLQTGIYEVHHFGCSNFLGIGFNDYPEFEDEEYRGPYGVCDNIENLLAVYPELEAMGRQFVVTLTPVVKSEQSPQGGWRWHKWGDYIGSQKPTCEYLFNEPIIDKVYVFHIYERVL